MLSYHMMSVKTIRWTTNTPFQQALPQSFNHGWKVAYDECIFWGFMRNQPGGGHLCARKPCDFGPDYKCLSAVGINVTTTFEH
eukprot:11919047-Ditylum_brightwellii.AAC.1